MKGRNRKMDSAALSVPSMTGVIKGTVLNSDGDILEETQRLIEEAELKLQLMEASASRNGSSMGPVNTLYSSEEPQLTSSDMKNRRLRQTLNSEMKKLEKQLQMQWKKQVTSSESAAAPVDQSGTVLMNQIPIETGHRETQLNKPSHRGRIRRPCRNLPALEHGPNPQHIVDMVRTARDSVHGALVAARQLSASLDNRSPRTSRTSRTSHRSLNHPETEKSIKQSSERPSAERPLTNRMWTETQVADLGGSRSCAEHGTKRKVCSCLRSNYEGLKQTDSKTRITEEKESFDCTRRKLELTRANVAVFEAKCTSAVKNDFQQPPKRKLQMSVLPSISIKRSLEKQVMPVIRVPSPGSSPDIQKRENCGVRTFQHNELQSLRGLQSPDEQHQPRNSSLAGPNVFKSQAEMHDSRKEPPEQVDTLSAEHSIALQQLGQHIKAVEELSNLNQSQIQEVLKKTSLRCRRRRSDRVVDPSSSTSSQSALLTDNTSNVVGTNGNIAYSSLSRFLETYHKASIDAKRSKQRAALRRKEEALHMRSEEEKFRSSPIENQHCNAKHVLIGPFKRAIANGNQEERSKPGLISLSSNQQTDPEPNVPRSLRAISTVENVADINAQDNIRNELNDEFENHYDHKRALHGESEHCLSVGCNLSEGDKLIKNVDDGSIYSSKSKSSISEDVAIGGVLIASSHQPSVATGEENSDEYEDDWEEENEGDKVIEEGAKTRDVGDGSERECHDETSEGPAHTLRTILEVEENSSISLSLIHQESRLQPSQSSTVIGTGGNKSEGSQHTDSKISSTEIDNAKSRRVSEEDSGSIHLETIPPQEMLPQRSVVGEDPVFAEAPKLISQEVQVDIRDEKSEEVMTATKERQVVVECPSNRTFLEITEALKKMLESVVCNVVHNKPFEEDAALEPPVDKKRSLLDSPPRDQRPPTRRFGVRFEDDVYGRRSPVKKYDHTSSGSANDDRMSSGSETGLKGSYSHYPSLKYNFAQISRRASKFRPRLGGRRSSASQTEVENLEIKGIDQKRDVETQVTPVKEESPCYGDKGVRRWHEGDDFDFHLRPSMLSLSRTRLSDPPRRLSLSLDWDPTERLLEFGRSSAKSMLEGRVGFGAKVNLKSTEAIRHIGDESHCDSLSSSTASSVQLPVHSVEHTTNNTLMSVSEGEILGYNSCSCSEGEVCECAIKHQKSCEKPSGFSKNSSKVKDSDPLDRYRSQHQQSIPNPQNMWSTFDSFVSTNDMDLSDHFSEGEIAGKLVGITRTLSSKSHWESELFDTVSKTHCSSTDQQYAASSLAGVAKNIDEIAKLKKIDKE